ncbi:rhodanese-like domain-containing protein [Paralimibaculum aggregatum]|uniref:Rhodanese-like domain-containing protein n=1 Tax=Paralimibaculum aggregatum TaxID=3036245 RepID=A0ABQ6LKL1_9RHOB|nr:rhodanese-like domain-containing protein [Limibaculum sp. NKW23]GMG82207.1 rhodanese-like domain-containing protein [Limibaculum sp. NKW23]
MSQPVSRVDAVDPSVAYDILRETPGTVLVDVRTRAEWTFVGLPDLGGIDRPLWLVEWAQFPVMSPNPGFLPRLRELIGEETPARILFICRSGGRSMHAAQAVAAAFEAEGRGVHCTNVAEGFEGDLDAEGRRGRAGGWKARGLPWAQS